MKIEHLILILSILTVILLSYHTFFQNSPQAIVQTTDSKDSVILIYKDSTHFYSKQIIKTFYEYKIDSVNIAYLPDSLLAKDIMSRTHRILDWGFAPPDKYGFGESRSTTNGNTNSKKSINALRQHYNNSSEAPSADSNSRRTKD